MEEKRLKIGENFTCIYGYYKGKVGKVTELMFSTADPEFFQCYQATLSGYEGNFYFAEHHVQEAVKEVDSSAFIAWLSK